MAAALCLLLIVLLPVIGNLLVRKLDQQARDRQRTTYVIHFPHELTEESIIAWIRATSGSLHASNMRWAGVPTIGFELWATSDGIQHRLRLPWQYADYTIAQLRSLVPGIRVTPEDNPPREEWTRAVEVGMTHATRPLRIYSASDMASSLLASVQALGAGERVLMQWVVTPALPAHKPIHKETRSDLFHPRQLVNGNLANRDEVNERRSKLEEPNVLAVLRVAAHADKPQRADHLIYRVRSSLSATRGPATRFMRRMVGQQKLQERIQRASSPVHWPAQLSAPELAALVAWPIGNPFVTGLPPVLSRQLAAPETVPRQGRILGRSNFPGNERPVAVSHHDSLRHLHIAGPTGVGKTTMLANLMKQDIEQGYGVVLIENKGDLFHTALDYIPPKRVEDAIVLDVTDHAFPVGFNIMGQGDPRIVIDELTDLFESMYDTKSVWTKEVLYHGLRTIASDPRLTFIDLGPLLVPMTSDEVSWREHVIRSLDDKELRQFWQRFDNQPRASQDRITQPVMDRIWQLNARPEIRHIIGQSTSSFQMTDVVAENKILLVNFAGLSRDTASLAGTLLINALWDAVKRTPSATPTFLYLDEFQDFLRLPIEPEEMLAKARGFGLGMVLAHQHLGQLSPKMREAVLANARTKVIFQTSNADAAIMAREFGSAVSERDFMHLAQYEAIARVATETGVSSPLSLVTNEPAKLYGRHKWVRYASREKYGRKLADVQREMEERRRIEPSKAKRKSRISGQDGFEGLQI